MGNRFHNKIHAESHYTRSNGNIESATDPIASHDHPYIGDIIFNGNVTSNNVFCVHLYATNVDSVLVTNSTILVDINNTVNLSLFGIITNFKLEYFDGVLLNSPIHGEILVFDNGDLINGTATYGITSETNEGIFQYATPQETAEMIRTDRVVNVQDLVAGGNLASTSLYTHIPLVPIFRDTVASYQFNLSDYIPQDGITVINPDKISSLLVSCTCKTTGNDELIINGAGGSILDLTTICNASSQTAYPTSNTVIVEIFLYASDNYSSYFEILDTFTGNSEFEIFEIVVYS